MVLTAGDVFKFFFKYRLQKKIKSFAKKKKKKSKEGLGVGKERVLAVYGYCVSLGVMF